MVSEQKQKVLKMVSDLEEYKSTLLIEMANNNQEGLQQELEEVEKQIEQAHDTYKLIQLKEEMKLLLTKMKTNKR